MSRSDDQRLDDMREQCALINHRVDPEQVWTIAVDEIPRLASGLGPPPT